MTGAQLKRHRQEAGLSQADLAAHLDVHKRSISAWERGVKVIPRAIELAVEHLGCRPGRCRCCGAVALHFTGTDLATCNYCVERCRAPGPIDRNWYHGVIEP